MESSSIVIGSNLIQQLIEAAAPESDSSVAESSRPGTRGTTDTAWHGGHQASS